MNSQTIRVSDLLHAAREEFAIKKSFSASAAMREVTTFFETVARVAYDSQFHWSKYNESQWEKYCAGDKSYGGACAFSLEEDGATPRRKGLCVCGPTGQFPDCIWNLWGPAYGDRFREAVAQMGRFSLDDIG